MTTVTDLIPNLTALLGDAAVLTKAEDLVPYGFDGTAAIRTRPGVVVLPTSTAQVSGCVKLAHAAGVPMVTRGSGTGLSGGSVPSPDALVICLAQMDKILEVDVENLTLRAQAGAVFDISGGRSVY
jgi:glycolate oxidase